jgi:hypothetical protein
MGEIRTHRGGVTYVKDVTTLDGSSSEVLTYSYLDYVELGSNIPGWKRNIANSSSATTSLSGLRTIVVKGSSLGILKAKTVPTFPVPLRIDVRVDGDCSPIGTDFDAVGDFSDVDSRVTTSFLSNCYNQQRTMPGIVVAGELGKTISSIRGASGTLFGLVSQYLASLKKGKRKRRSRIDKEAYLRDAWLEASYGWIPLLSDIRSAAKAAARLANYVSNTEFVVASGDDSDSTIIGPGGGSASQLSWKYVVRQTSKRSVKMYGRVRSKCDNPGVFSSQTLGFDPRSFIPSIWNLIPYSFLVDYFTNVGEDLEAICFNSSDIAWVNKTSRLELSRYSAEFAVQPHFLNPSIWDVTDYRMSSTGTKVTKVLVNREAVSTDELIPVFRFRLPFNPLFKAANIAALVSQHRRLVPF